MHRARRVPVSESVPRRHADRAGHRRRSEVTHVTRPSPAPVAPAAAFPARVSRPLSAGVLLALTATVLIADAVHRAPGALDLRVLRAIQELPLPGLAAVLWPVDRLTSAVGAVIAWGLVLLTLLLARWWLPALAVLCLPAAAVVDNAFRLFLVARERPSADQVIRTASGTDHNAFPSGHVLGAVLLYGLLFVLAERIHRPLLRLVVRLLCGWVIATVGIGRLWYGAHWPTDVLAGYAMGGVLLVSLVQVFRWAEQAGGVGDAFRRLRDRAVGARPLARRPACVTVPVTTPAPAIALASGPPVDHMPGFARDLDPAADGRLVNAQVLGARR